MNHWETAFMHKPSSYFVSESALTSQKVTPEIIINLLQRVAGSGVCVFLCACVCSYFCFCATRVCAMRQRERERERATLRERERERGNKKKWRVLINQVKVQPVVAATAIFFLLRVSRHLTLPSSALLISSTSTSAGGGGGGAAGLGGGLSSVSDEVCRYLSSNRS